MMDRHAVYVGRRKVVPRICIVDGKRHSRTFLEERLEELGFTTCGSDLVLAGLPSVTP